MRSKRFWHDVRIIGLELMAKLFKLGHKLTANDADIVPESNGLHGVYQNMCRVVVFLKFGCLLLKHGVQSGLRHLGPETVADLRNLREQIGIKRYQAGQWRREGGTHP
jgi:hypothetical protein